MKNAFYMARNTVIINYTKEYCNNSSQLIDTEGFEIFINGFLEDLQGSNAELYNWLTRVLDKNDQHQDIKRLLKTLMVLDIDDIQHEAMNHRAYLLEIVELAYTFWREKARFSIIFTKNEAGLQLANFIDADTAFNQMCIGFYRSIQEKLQGSNNKVYRQLQAGTNASLILRNYQWNVFKGYEALESIPFINTMMLRTPLIFHPKSNKRTGTFVKKDAHLIDELDQDTSDWMCFPCKVGSLLTFIYFQQDFLPSVVGLANLFELASDEECQNNQPDCIMLFGNKDGKDETVYEFDEANKVWVGKISYQDVIEYFGYLKKMALTLFNLAMMQRGCLPIHGAMLNVYLNDGSKKGIVLMGDSGAGKSETIEAMSKISKGHIIRQEIIFDDMGVMYYDGNNVIASGSEIGAFVRLDDLEKGSAYRDMDRSIFFNPETHNARVVLPCTPYNTVVEKHKVDCFMYANNYTDKRGLRMISNMEEAKPIFKEGKRFALGTTQEKGLSTTYFANPFGPMQSQDVCNPLIDQVFDALVENKVIVGEIYTCLGLEGKGDNGIDDAAKELLALIKTI
ncbi:MAG: hypothetical protein R3Y57_02910 [Erysipelotrichaceae bacterium]